LQDWPAAWRGILNAFRPSHPLDRFDLRQPQLHQHGLCVALEYRFRDFLQLVSEMRGFPHSTGKKVHIIAP
jgi:hypothetical protein